MANIKNQILGHLQGRIADVTIKYRNGKPYVARKPVQTNTGKDPATIFKQNQGRFIGKLSKEIYRIEILKKIWSLNDVQKGYTYQQIWSRNYKSIKVDDLSGSVTLIPETQFLVKDPIIEIKDNSIVKLTASPLGKKDKINPLKEKQILAVGIIILKNRIGIDESEISYLTMISQPVDLDITAPIDITLDILPKGDKSYKNYLIKKSYITLITLDKTLSPIKSSEVITSG
jgi:hypothetical protein